MEFKIIKTMFLCPTLALAYFFYGMEIIEDANETQHIRIRMTERGGRSVFSLKSIVVCFKHCGQCACLSERSVFGG